MYLSKIKNLVILIAKKIISVFSYNKNQFSIEGAFIYNSTCRIINSKITIGKNSKVVLADNVNIDGYEISILKGEIIVGTNTRFERGSNIEKPSISILDGSLKIGENCIIRSDFSIRFGGKCKIGDYTGIMEHTEIRSDECLEIGDFNMISYECMIYDTNTHCDYTRDVRRQMTIKDFPYIGLEIEKPPAKALKIGDDCWIGKRALLLKGVEVGNNSTIGACAVVTKNIPENSIAYGNPAQIKVK